MSDSAGLALAVGDGAALVASGAATVTRGELRRRADELVGGPAGPRRSRRVMVRSDDPVQILRAIDGAHRAGADLWIAHTSLPAAFVDEVVAQAGIELVIDEDGTARELAAPGAAAAPPARAAST